MGAVKVDDVAGADRMSGVDFRDGNKARAWLEKQSAEVRHALACRAALRVCANIFQVEPEKLPPLGISVFRALLISAVCGRRPNTDRILRNGGFSASRSVDSAAHSAPTIGSAARSAAMAAGAAAILTAASADMAADSAAHSAASTAATADQNFQNSGGHAAAFSASSKDSQNLRISDFAEPVWLDIPVPPQIAANHRNFIEFLTANRNTWGFWHDWYLAMWEGRFTDWDLAIEVAKIPDDVWERGAEAVAAEIAEISDKHLSEKLPQAEVIFETESGEYDVKTAIADPSKLTKSVLSRAGFAYNMALESNACDLNTMSMPAKLLRHVFENCKDDPNAIEQFFRQASDIIKRKIEEGQYGLDDELEVLTRTLDESALQMRADHPEVGDAADKRLKQTLREIDDAKRLEIAASIDAMVEGSTGRLATEFELSAETTRSDSGTAAQATAIKMSSERAAKISIAERAKKVEGSGIMSGVKIGIRGHSLVELVIRLMSGGG